MSNQFYYHIIISTIKRLFQADRNVRTSHTRGEIQDAYDHKLKQ